MDAAKSCTANFVAISYSLTVSKTGNGTVSGGRSFVAGATVNLTATPAMGYVFQSWSPTPCASSFKMPANNLSCTATFVPLYTLKVSKVGGNGTITSTPPGISCGTDCTEDYAVNTNVQLTTTADTDYAFSGWTGSCTGTTPTTVVKMDAAKNCTANFVCASVLSVTPTNQSFPRSGGAFTATVNVGSCSTPVKWTASSSASWLTVSPTSGTGNATVKISVQSKPILFPSSKMGVITVTATGATGSPKQIVVTQ